MYEEINASQQEGTVIETGDENEVLLSEKWFVVRPGFMYKVHQDDKRNETFNLDKIALTPKTYCINNKMIARVDQNKVLYVAPASSIDVEALKAAGYKESLISVPLSDGEVPVLGREKWERMRRDADPHNRI